MSRKTVMLSFLVVALLLSGVVSYWASTAPDGLDKAMTQSGLLAAEQPRGAASEVGQSPAKSTAPLADYRVRGIASPFVSNALAGVGGTLLVLVIVLGLGRFLRKRNAAAPILNK
jgi:hypothetical protein